jgi:hypothetical protein
VVALGIRLLDRHLKIPSIAPHNLKKYGFALRLLYHVPPQ